MQCDRRVGAGGEERRGAKIHEARIAAQNVPTKGERDILKDEVAEVEGVVVAHGAQRQRDHDETRHRQCDRPDREPKAAKIRHAAAPSRPRGRSAKNPSNRPKARAGDQDGPRRVAVMSSMTPKRRPAINVPGSEPRPPMMTIAKRRPMKIRPDAESTGWMRISAPPASAARAVDMAKPMVFTRTGSTPISRRACHRHNTTGAGVGYAGRRRTAQGAWSWCAATGGGERRLVVGASGLLLLAFGAKWLPDDAEVQEGARRMAEQIVAGVRAGDPMAREAALEVLKRPGKTPDAPDRPDAGDEPAVRLLDRLYDKLSYRDRGTVITGRIAFYGGLVLVFAAGVLLYRRTPESNRGTW